MKRAILTGASGFIGSWLAMELLNSDYEMTLIVRNPNKLLPEIQTSQKCEIIQKDLSELSIVDIPSKDYDVFFNLSWSGVSPEQKNNIHLQVSNIQMSLNALEICNELRCKLFISAGTVAEYALTTDIMDLYAKQSPNDMYGAAKVSAHFFLEVQARKIKQPFIWTVIPSTFGERRMDDNIITYTIKSLLNNEKPRYGNLEQMWDFLYVSEVARALRLIGERATPGRVYGIGSGEYRPLKEYIKIIRDEINPKLELGIGDVPSMSRQSFSSCVNIYDLIRDTGFKPEVSFQSGVRKTINWFKKNNINILNDNCGMTKNTYEKMIKDNKIRTSNRDACIICNNCTERG